jgi:excinuclease ABC subunit B
MASFASDPSRRPRFPRIASRGLRPHIARMAIEIRTSLAEPETGATFVPHRPARPAKAEGGRRFVLASDYSPAGDQPTAIKELTEAARAGEKDQVLLGVTGSGKTFTMAKEI